MTDKNLNKYANRLVNAFLKNKIISPLPKKYTKKISNAQIFRKLCESKIKKPISGFKAAGTGIPVLKKLKEKEPFYATVYKHNVLKNNRSVKIDGLDWFFNMKLSKDFKEIKGDASFRKFYRNTKKNSGRNLGKNCGQVPVQM